MILNPLSVAILLIGLLTLLLAALQTGFALKLHASLGPSPTPDLRTAVEEQTHLMLTLAVVLLTMRMLAWPLFYATLQSFVPDIPGAMCIYGVTQALPTLSGALQVLKPIGFFLSGLWLLLYALNRAAKTAPLFRRNLALLAGVSAFLAADALGDLFYFLTLTPRQEVTCCTLITDLPTRASAVVPRTLLGAEFDHPLLSLYFAAQTLLAGGIGLALFRHAETSPARRAGEGALALGGAAALGIAAIAFIEIIAPRLMGLPFHHDLYCFIQYVPDGSLMLVLPLLGLFALLWAASLERLGRHEETASHLKRYTRRLWGLALLAFVASPLMVAVHFLVDRWLGGT
ncbi:MAG: hypothetical protein HZA23_00395 [Nitrospirae bacterium]|nr:hypothetical protein [Nitrospirota bacterium]